MSDQGDRSRPARRIGLRQGARAVVPLALAAIPFGLVYGVAVADSTTSTWVGVAGSWLVLAGAAQLSMIDLIDSDTAWPLVVGTGLVINARFALYSAALAPSFSAFPTRWRIGLPYLMTDQTATLSLNRYLTEDDPAIRRWFFLGAGLTFAAGWWIGTIAGAVLGGSIPDSVDIGFAIPAMFIALLVPAVTDRIAIVAAVTAATVTVAASGLPNGTNIIIGALAGVAVGTATSRPHAEVTP